MEFLPGENAAALGLSGRETLTIHLPAEFKPRERITVSAERSDGAAIRFQVLSRLDTPVDIAYYLHGGVLKFVLRKLVQS